MNPRYFNFFKTSKRGAFQKPTNYMDFLQKKNLGLTKYIFFKDQKKNCLQKIKKPANNEDFFLNIILKIYKKIKADIFKRSANKAIF